MTVRIGAALQQHRLHLQSISSPKDRAQIAGVLNPVQQQHSPLGLEGFPLRQPAQEQRSLGGLHRRDGFHHILRHPDPADSRRRLRFHAVRQDHRVQPRKETHRFLQQLCSVRHKKPRFFPEFPGSQKFFHLLQQRILS